MGRRHQDSLRLIAIHFHLLTIHKETIQLQSLHLDGSLGTAGIRYGERSQMESILLLAISQELGSSHLLTIIQ